MSGKAWRWLIVLALVASVVMALSLIGPAVPNEIRMLTGPEGSAFHADGLRYQEILSRHGVTVHLEETSGSVENLAKLRESEVPTAAYLWGIPDSETREKPVPEGVQSLGTMSLQPLWVFVSKDTDLNGLKDLRGSRIDVGEAGSDSRLLALFLLREEGVGNELEIAQERALTADQASGAIQDSQVGAVIAVGKIGCCFPVVPV